MKDGGKFNAQIPRKIEDEWGGGNLCTNAASEVEMKDGGNLMHKYRVKVRMKEEGNLCTNAASR